MTIGLGIAFRNKPVERITVDIEQGAAAGEVLQALQPDPTFIAAVYDPDACRMRLRTGKTEVIVTASRASAPRYEYAYDPTRPESLLARSRPSSSYR